MARIDDKLLEGSTLGKDSDWQSVRSMEVSPRRPRSEWRWVSTYDSERHLERLRDYRTG